MPTPPAVRHAAAQRRADVMRMRLAGVPFRVIGDQLGITRQRAYQLYDDALHEVVREPAEQVITADLERLDMLWRAMLDRAVHGSARHAEACLRVLERRAKLLGLDAPTKTVARVSFTAEEEEALDADIEALLAAAAAPDAHPDQLGG